MRVGIKGEMEEGKREARGMDIGVRGVGGNGSERK